MDKGKKGGSYRQDLQALLVSLGLILLIFASYHFIENRWIFASDPEVVNILHLLKTSFLLFILLSFTAWFIFRRQVPVFPVDFTDAAELLIGESNRNARLRQHALWFINFRWLAVIVSASLAIVATHLTQFLRPETHIPLFILVGVLALTNIIFTFWARSSRSPYSCIIVQVFSDLVILTGFLHYSGGIENPLFLIYSFHVIIAGILLPKRSAYIMAVAACALFAFLTLGEYFQIIAHYSHAGEGAHASYDPYFVTGRVIPFAGVLICIAYLTSLVMDYVRKNEERLVHMAGVASAERQKLDTVVNAVGGGLLLLDQSLHVLWFNKRYKELFSSEDQILGHSCKLSGYKSGKRGNCPTCISARVLEDGSTTEEEREIITPEQGRRFYHITASPIIDENGEITRVVELIQDITVRRSMEMELFQAQTNLMKAERLAAMGELAAEVTHEVRTPLNALSINLQLLKRELKKENSDDDQMLWNLVGILENEIKRINSVVEEFIRFCRVPPLNLREWDVMDIVSDVLQLLSEQASQEGITIEVVQENTQPLITFLDVDQMRQVLLNLITNAIRATRREGEIIIASGLMDDGFMKISVKDTGEGIPPENMESIFKPFFSTRENSTGIGLTIVSRIVKEHRGRLICHSEPGKGSTFEVILPCDTRLKKETKLV